jgi:hypothetical protein
LHPSTLLPTDHLLIPRHWTINRGDRGFNHDRDNRVFKDPQEQILMNESESDVLRTTYFLTVRIDGLSGPKPIVNAIRLLRMQTFFPHSTRAAASFILGKGIF